MYRISTLLVTVLSFFVTHGQAPGELDLSFSGDGKRSLPMLQGSLKKVACQSDGAIIVGVQGTPIRLIRLLEDGTVDPLFGTDGLVTLSPVQDGLQDLLVGSDDRIFLVGWASVTALSRDGMLDPSYGTNGRADVRGPGGAVPELWDAAIRPDDGLYMAGSLDSLGCVFCYDPQGHPSATFGQDGLVTFGSPGRNYGVEVVSTAFNDRAAVLFHSQTMVPPYAYQTGIYELGQGGA